MSRALHKVSTVARTLLEVYDSSNVAVTGLVTGNFTLLLSKDGVDDATAVTIAETGSGRYMATFTPASTGVWHLVARHATHAPRGWHETWDVTTYGNDIAAGSTAGAPTADQNADALLDRANGVETGVTVRQALQRVGATTAGECTVAGAVVTFKGLDDATTRVTATVAATGARSEVTYA